MITLDTPIILATSQTFKFENLVINTDGGLSAIVQFGRYKETGERLDACLIRYEGADFNTFWTNFNSGKFLYDELSRVENLGVVVPVTVESDFVNVI